MTQKYSNNKKYINNNNNIIDKAKLSMMIMLAGLITFINNACEKEHIINDKTEQNNNNGNKPNPTPNPQPTPDKTISFKEALELIIDSTKTAQNNNLAKIKAEYEKIKDKELIIKSNGNLYYDSLQSILFNKNEKRIKSPTKIGKGRYIKSTSVLNRLMKNKQENATTNDKVKAGFIYFNNKLNNSRTYTLSKETLESYNKALLDYLSNSEMLRLYNDNKDSTTLVKNRDELKQYLMNFYKELENSTLKVSTWNGNISEKQLLERLALNNKDSIDLLLASIIKNYEYYGSDSFTIDFYDEDRAKMIEPINKCLEYKAYQKMINKAENKKNRNR